MNDWHDASRIRRDGVTIPVIWVALALSLLIHVAVLWVLLPRLRLPSFEDAERGKASGALVVDLAPAPGPAPAAPSLPALRAQPPPTLKAPPPRAPPPRPIAPEVVLKSPAPDVPSRAPAPSSASLPPPAPPVAEPTPARAPAGGDLASFIEARRRARGESAPAASSGSVSSAPQVEDDNARAKRIAAANLGTQRAQTFGYDPSKGGGVFQIVSMGYDYAEFFCFGWNRDIRRNTKQLIEVRKGNNSDIRIAVVRKMIAIIREYEREDFLWESHRLGRELVLSARTGDNAGLEDFMMHEFFPDPRGPR